MSSKKEKDRDEQGTVVNSSKVSDSESLQLIDLTDLKQLKLTAHAKKRLKNRFGINQPEHMIKWALTQIHGGRVIQVDVIANQLRVKIKNNNIILVVNVIDHSLITAYPDADLSTKENQSKMAAMKSFRDDQTYADLIEYLQEPLKGYLALQERGLVANLNYRLKSMLSETETISCQSLIKQINVGDFEKEIQEIQRLIANYKNKTDSIKKALLLNTTPKESMDNQNLSDRRSEI